MNHSSPVDERHLAIGLVAFGAFIVAVAAIVGVVPEFRW